MDKVTEKIPYKKLKFNMKYLPWYVWGTFEQPLLCPKAHDALMNSDPLLLIPGGKKVFTARIQATGTPNFSNYFDAIKHTTLTLQNFAAALNLIHFSSLLCKAHYHTHQLVSQTISVHFKIFTVGINSTIKMQKYVARAVLDTTVHVMNTVIKNTLCTDSDTTPRTAVSPRVIKYT